MMLGSEGPRPHPPPSSSSSLVPTPWKSPKWQKMVFWGIFSWLSWVGARRWQESKRKQRNRKVQFLCLCICVFVFGSATDKWGCKRTGVCYFGHKWRWQEGFAEHYYRVSIGLQPSVATTGLRATIPHSVSSRLLTTHCSCVLLFFCVLSNLSLVHLY